MKFFHVTSLDECKQAVGSALPRSVFDTVSVCNKDAVFRTLADDVVSPDVFPPYTRSTMDGFAIKSEDVYGASGATPAFLKVKGKIPMGKAPDFTIEKGQAAAIATGGVIPEGANAVAMVENVEILGDEIAVYSPLKMGENVVLRGEEIEKGDIVAKRGERVTPLLAGVFASVGIEKVKVYDKIKVAVISTGDELVDVSEQAENGKIRDVNTTYLAALLNAGGYCLTFEKRIADDENELRETLNQALDAADIVLISGGSSIGAKDLTEKVLSAGEILLHGVALKPGKPTLISRFGDKLVFGLPGNPFAAACVFTVICDDVIKKARGEKEKFLFAYAKTNFPSCPGRTTLQPVSVEFDGTKYLATPVFLKSAHLYSATKANGTCVIPETAEGIYEGTLLKIRPFIGKDVL